MNLKQLPEAVLMVHPKHFGFNVQTSVSNVFQCKQIDLTADVIQSKALVEFDHVVRTLYEHSVRVVIMEDTEAPIKPDAVFPNNWFSTWHDGTLSVYPMEAPNRQIEVRLHDLQAVLKNHGFSVKKVEDWRGTKQQDGGVLEGTGSMICDHVNRKIYASRSSRTSEALLKQVCLQHGYSPVIFTAVDRQGRPFYHTNVIMNIGLHYAVVCLKSIECKNEREQILSYLRNAEKEVVDISLEQVENFAGNMLQLKGLQGNTLTVLSERAYSCLNAEQIRVIETMNNRLVPIPIDTIEAIGGGSVRCMLAELFL